MKRWREDPDEQVVTDLLAPLAHHVTPPDARARVWRAVSARTRPGARGRHRTAWRVGALVLALAIAGTAAARMLRAPASPPAPVPAPAPVITAEAPASPVSAFLAPSAPPTPAPPAASSASAAASPAPSPGAPPVRAASPSTSSPAAPPRSRGSSSTASSIASSIASPPAASPAASPTPSPAPSAADAELAAYKEARAAMRGDLAASLARWSAFLDAFPGGRFDAEARLSIIESKVRLGRLAAAEPDVEAFLSRHPGSERAREVRFVRAELQRTMHGRCDLALADYREAAASSRVGEDALFFRGFCAHALGDRTERDLALRGYLARAPAGRHAAAARALLEDVHATPPADGSPLAPHPLPWRPR